MYDRTKLRTAAERRGDSNANRLAIRLGVGRMTAHRLWNGTAVPSGQVAAKVHRAYRVKLDDLLIEQETNETESAA